MSLSNDFAITKKSETDNKNASTLDYQQNNSSEKFSVVRLLKQSKIVFVIKLK